MAGCVSIACKVCEKGACSRRGPASPQGANSGPALHLQTAAYLGHSGCLLACRLVLFVTGQNDHLGLLGAVAQLQQDPAL